MASSSGKPRSASDSKPSTENQSVSADVVAAGDPDFDQLMELARSAALKDPGGNVNGSVGRMMRQVLDTLRREQSEALVRDLHDWWMGQARGELEKLLPKVDEYGASDLVVMGSAMRELWPGNQDAPEGAAVEMAIAFYALGKIARAFGAYQRGQLPSDDTWDDLAVYSRMAKRVREYGSWPGNPGARSTTNG